MQHTLAILNAEEEYACSLMEFFNQQDECWFRARAFSDLNAYLEYEKQHPIDIVLYDESISNDSAKAFQTKACYYLTENPKESMHEEVKSFFMYQSAKKLLRQIMEQFAADGNAVKDYTKTLQTRVYGVCAASGDLRQSVFALALANEHAKKERTLWLSLQPFVTADVFEMEEKSSLSEVIYILQQEDANRANKVKDVICHYESLDYLLGVDHFSDLTELSREEVDEFVGILCSNCSYDVILIDLPVLTKAFNEWADQCQQIYELVFPGAIYERAREQFHKQLALQEQETKHPQFVTVDCKDSLMEANNLKIAEIVGSAWTDLANRFCN